MFQPENPQPNLPIKPYPVRKYHYSHNLCHGLLHNAVYCAVRTHDLSLAQLFQEKKSRSWRSCSAACPSGRDCEWPRHTVYSIVNLGYTIPPHLHCQENRPFYNLNPIILEFYFLNPLIRFTTAGCEIPTITEMSRCVLPSYRSLKIALSISSVSENQISFNLESSKPNFRGSKA